MDYKISLMKTYLVGSKDGFNGLYGDLADEKFEQIIDLITLSDVPDFVRNTHILVRYYGFDLRKFLGIAKEKIINLALFEGEQATVQQYIVELDDLCRGIEEKAPRLPAWLVIPAEQEEAEDLFKARS